MSELISGKEAFIALANGEDVEWTHFSVGEWYKVPQKTAKLQYFLDDDLGWKFRLKPRTIMIEDVEVPAPFEPKEGEDCRCYYVNTTFKDGFDWYHSSHHKDGRIVWRNMEEIRQVVAALRKLFKGERNEKNAD